MLISANKTLSFPTKVNHLGTMNLNLVYQIVCLFCQNPVFKNLFDFRVPFLRQILQEQCFFGIHFGEPKTKLTNIQTLDIVLGPRGRKFIGWSMLAHKSRSISFFFHNKQPSFPVKSSAPSCSSLSSVDLPLLKIR